MKIINRIPFALITLGLIMFGGMKLFGAEQMLQNMGNLHYPEYFTRILGFVEIVLAISLWSNKTRNIAMIVLFGIFSGAIGSHLGHGDGLAGSVPAAVFLVLTAISIAINLKDINPRSSSF